MGLFFVAFLLKSAKIKRKPGSAVLKQGAQRIQARGRRGSKENTVMNFQISNKIAGIKPSAIREILKLSADPNIIAFSAGNPAPQAFPVEEIRR